VPCVIQEFAVPGAIHGTLGSIHGQSQFLPQEAFDTIKHSLTGMATANIDVTVISIADELVASAFQFFVQLIEQDIGQKRLQGKRT
jgi:hypothetical protein